MNNIQQLLNKVYIHPLLWFMAGIGIITGRFRELLMLFFIVFVHEMGHAACAHFFSWRIKRITLLPFGGVAEMDEHGNRPPHEELLVILAGPIQHLWLMGGAYLLHHFSVITYETYQLFILQNMTILLFNLLPVWPLDGGKLLFIVLSLKLPFNRAHNLMLYSSFSIFLLLCLFVILFKPYQLNMWIILSFLAVSLAMEWKQRHYVFMRFLLERYYGKKQPIANLKPLTVNGREKIYDVLLLFQRGCKHPVIITGDKEQSQLDENELLHAFFAERRAAEPVGDLTYLY